MYIWKRASKSLTNKQLFTERALKDECPLLICLKRDNIIFHDIGNHVPRKKRRFEITDK